MLATLSCSDGGGSSSTTADSGIVSMSITDAKPMLPANITAFKVKFDEVLVHKSGGGWISLPLAESPHIIDLLQFIDGDTTEFVPPVRLDYGKYTQVRIVISPTTLVTVPWQVFATAFFYEKDRHDGFALGSKGSGLSVFAGFAVSLAKVL